MQNVQPGEYGVSNEPDQADLALALPGLETVIGQQIGGQLSVMPHKDFSTEVRLELVRRESVYYGDGNLKETTLPFKLAGNTQFVAGQPQASPFQVVIPPDAPPSIETPHGQITWRIKGILARRLRQDTLVEQEILVYPAREG